METHAYTLRLGTNPDRLREVRYAQVFGRCATVTIYQPPRTTYKVLLLVRRPTLLFRIAPWLSRFIPDSRLKRATLTVQDLVITKRQYEDELEGVPVYVE